MRISFTPAKQETANENKLLIFVAHAVRDKGHYVAVSGTPNLSHAKMRCIYLSESTKACQGYCSLWGTTFSHLCGATADLVGNQTSPHLSSVQRSPDLARSGNASAHPTVVRDVRLVESVGKRRPGNVPREPKHDPPLSTVVTPASIQPAEAGRHGRAAGAGRVRSASGKLLGLLAQGSFPISTACRTQQAQAPTPDGAAMLLRKGTISP